MFQLERNKFPKALHWLPELDEKSELLLALASWFLLTHVITLIQRWRRGTTCELLLVAPANEQLSLPSERVYQEAWIWQVDWTEFSRNTQPIGYNINVIRWSHIRIEIIWAYILTCVYERERLAIPKSSELVFQFKSKGWQAAMETGELMAHFKGCQEGEISLTPQRSVFRFTQTFSWLDEAHCVKEGNLLYLVYWVKY